MQTYKKLGLNVKRAEKGAGWFINRILYPGNKGVAIAAYLNNNADVKLVNGEWRQK